MTANVPWLFDAATKSELEQELVSLEQILSKMDNIYRERLCKPDMDEGKFLAEMSELAQLAGQPPDTDAFDAVLHALARTLEIANALIVAFQSGQLELDPHPTAWRLMMDARQNKTGPGLDLDETIKNLPWMLKFTLDSLLSTKAYDLKKSTGASVAARCLAVFLDNLRGHDGLLWDPPAQHRPAAH